MGATVTTGKVAKALRTKNGRVGYVLFEETYEKNVHPHTPEWACVGMGYATDVVKRIFNYGAGCEGGMLQNRSGHITPEGYIQGWLQCLASPRQMGNVEGLLKFGSSFRSTLPEGIQDEIQAVLAGKGMAEVYEQIAGNGFKASLYEHFDILSAVYGTVHCGAWRFITDCWPTSGLVSPEFGFSPDKVVAPAMAIPRMFRIGCDEILIAQPDGTFRTSGWEYSVVGSFVTKYANRELQYPGSYMAAIKAYRKACKSAPQVPGSALILVSDKNATTPYHKAALRKFAQICGASGSEFEVTFGEVLANTTEEVNAVYHLVALGHLATWAVYDASPLASQSESLELF